MTYIIMAIQEEGSETRISDFDQTERGFLTQEAAYNCLEKARECYPEFRQIWVEELKDQQYWMEQAFYEEGSMY